MIGALAACSTAPAMAPVRRSRSRCRTRAISGFNPWQIPLADYPRRYPMLARGAAAQRRRQVPRAPTADGYVRILPAGQRHWRASSSCSATLRCCAGPVGDPLFRLINGDVDPVASPPTRCARTRADVFADGASPRRAAGADQPARRVRRRRADAGTRLLSAHRISARRATRRLRRDHSTSPRRPAGLRRPAPAPGARRAVRTRRTAAHGRRREPARAGGCA